jgi:mannosidase alpha-like ER degradation enhancer 3
MAKMLQKKKLAVEWYRDELLLKALDIGYRLLPAFNTTTGIPYPKVSYMLFD